MGLFFGRRETLNEQLAREAGLGSQGEPRRSVGEVLRPIRAWWESRARRKLAKHAGEGNYLSEQEAARGREELGFRAPADRPPGYGG